MTPSVARIALPLVLLAAPACTAMGPPGAPVAREAATGQQYERAIIRTADIRVSVDEPAEALPAVTGLAESLGGFVDYSQVTREGSASARIRVPSAELTHALDAIAALGREEERKLTARDVTEQLSDLEASLKNNLALRDRLRALLQRAKTVEEVLKVESELNRIQTTIDQQQGRIKRLESEVDLSTISVRLEQKRILGPLGLALKGLNWVIGKLFVIRG